MFILLLGAPGSGKGTQGKVLAERLGLPKITTGDLIRSAMKAGTPLGLEAKKFYDAGKLVPDSDSYRFAQYRACGIARPVFSGFSGST